MSESYQKLFDHLRTMEQDVEKFYDKGQAAAGTRVRKSLSELKKMAQDMRNEIQDIKKQRQEEKTP
ncbi:MAG: histone H1 [Melioribacteraceae bacterium]|nr:histone H1 [Melioribacteraceae bacterium]